MKNLDFSCLVSMLSKDANWMLDVRAASGRVVLRRAAAKKRR